MPKFNSKDDVLNYVFNELNKVQSDLIISSAQDKDVNNMIERTYRAIETAKMATRGLYHTTNHYN